MRFQLDFVWKTPFLSLVSPIQAEVTLPKRLERVTVRTSLGTVSVHGSVHIQSLEPESRAEFIRVTLRAASRLFREMAGGALTLAVECSRAVQGKNLLLTEHVDVCQV